LIVTKKLRLETKGNCHIIDITGDVQRGLAEAKLNAGTVTVFVMGSTAGVTTIECESGLLADFEKLWERIAPGGISYDHDADVGEGNGHSHVRASLLGPSLVVPFSDRKLLLGSWQQIVLIDFDNRPRSRQVVLQIMGE
jgi:secondary thiamine-phosphate synthase enzyme